MRVVVAFAGSTSADTRAGVIEQAPDVEFVDVGRTPVAYYELLRSLWSDGQGFVLIEHDVVPAPGTLDAFGACPSPWCSTASDTWEWWGRWFSAGKGREWLASGLCCNRFRRSVILANPDLFDLPMRDRHWAKLDCATVGRITTHDPHCHHDLPHEHRHPYSATQADRRRDEVAAWRLAHKVAS